MRGHEPLIAMRLKHKRPAWVSVAVCKDSWLARHWHEEGMSGPHVLIEPSDSIDRMDLRFLVGLHVDIDGDVADEARVKAVFEACLRAGASRVIAGIHRPRGNTGELEMLELLDSAGVLTWLAGLSLTTST